MAKSIKENLQSLVKQATDSKRNVPIQKVVPIENSQISTTENKRKRKNFRMFFSDYEMLLKLRNFKVIKEHQEDFNLSDGIAEGINLLADKYNVVRGQKKMKFRIGRRVGVHVEREKIKNTSANLLISDIDLMSDILYHKTNVIGEVDYTVVQFVRELVMELDKKYKGKL